MFYEPTRTRPGCTGLAIADSDGKEFNKVSGKTPNTGSVLLCAGMTLLTLQSVGLLMTWSKSKNIFNFSDREHALGGRTTAELVGGEDVSLVGAGGIGASGVNVNGSLHGIVTAIRACGKPSTTSSDSSVATA